MKLLNHAIISDASAEMSRKEGSETKFINDLIPNEIVLKILGYLQYRELLMSSRTCRRWKCVADAIFKKSKVLTKSSTYLRLNY